MNPGGILKKNVNGLLRGNQGKGSMEAIPGEITAIIQEDTRNYTLVEILSKLMEEQLNKFSDVLF